MLLTAAWWAVTGLPHSKINVLIFTLFALNDSHLKKKYPCLFGCENVFGHLSAVVVFNCVIWPACYQQRHSTKSLVSVLHWGSSGLGLTGWVFKEKRGNLHEGWILFKRGWKPISVCCVSALSRFRGKHLWAQRWWLPKSQLPKRGYMRGWCEHVQLPLPTTMDRYVLQKTNAGLLAFTQCTTGVAYGWMQLASAPCSAVWGADVSATLKRKLFASKPPQWRVVCHCTRQCYRLLCTWVWQTGTVILEPQRSTTIRAAHVLEWITL